MHARVDGVAVGKLSLNFTSISQETASVFVSRLSLAMKELLPFTQHIPLTIEYLNNATLAPKKDYEANKYVILSSSMHFWFQTVHLLCSLHFLWFNVRLVSGVLQLAEGSHLTVDETKLQSGTLNSTGVENTRSLKNLTEVQQVIIQGCLRAFAQ